MSQENPQTHKAVIPEWAADEIRATWEAARDSGSQMEAFRILERMVDRLGYGRIEENPPLCKVPMRIYLDDERATPAGWHRAYWPEEVIALLKDPNNLVVEISLDHDLGDDDHGTGYHVLLWIEEAVVTQGFKPPKMGVHSANSSARAKMEQAIAQIHNLAQR